MSGETILDLFDDVCDILDRLRIEVSALTTSDTGNDPTTDIRDRIDDLREKLAALTSDERTSDLNPQPTSIQPQKEMSHD